MSTGLGGIFLFGLCNIGLDFIISWLWDIFFPRKATPCLKGRHVLITGGSKGIGKEVAKEFAQRGANVTIFARNPQQLSEACQEISHAIPNTTKYSSERPKILDIAVDITSDFEIVDESVKYVSKIISKTLAFYIIRIKLPNCFLFNLRSKNILQIQEGNSNPWPSLHSGQLCWFCYTENIRKFNHRGRNTADAIELFWIN